MSIESAFARIAEINRALGISSPTSPQASAAPQAGEFQSQLDKAKGSSRAGAPGPAFAEQLIATASQKYGVDPNLIRAVMRAESNFDPKAGSSAGAQGLMQLMPDTARGLGVTDLSDPAQNVDAGVKYLKEQLQKFGRVDLALAAYNAGPGAVQKYGGIPPYGETQAYVKKIMAEIS